MSDLQVLTEREWKGNVFEQASCPGTNIREIMLKIAMLNVIFPHMSTSISHDRTEETPEAKARWFQSLSLEERMEILCAFTDLILAINPGIVEARDAQQTQRRVRVLSGT